MSGKQIFPVVLIITAVLMAGCASGPEAEETESQAQQQETASVEQQTDAAQAEQTEAEPEMAEAEQQEPMQAEQQPEMAQTEPADEMEGEQVAATEQASDADAPEARWMAVSVQAYRNGQPYQIPSEYLQHEVYGKLEEGNLLIEVPAVDFRITGNYTQVDDNFFRVTPTEYVNVPQGIQEIADTARDRLGAELPDSYYFTVQRNGGTAIVEAEGLDFYLISEWVRTDG